MAAKFLLPGIAGAFSISVPVGAVAADTIDMSRCLGGVSVYVSNTNSATGTFAILESYDGTNFPARSATHALTNDTVTRYDYTDGPFGIWKLDGANVATAAITVTITGFALS